MAIRDDFIEEIKEGDYVELVYGQSIKIVGFIIKLTSSMVRVKVDENSSPRISLDSIISYDTPSVPVSISSEPDNVVGEPKTEMEEYAEVFGTIPLDDAVMPNDAEIADLKAFKNCITDGAMFRFAESIISKFLNMSKDVPCSVEKARDKLHDIRAAVLNILKTADSDSWGDINAVFASMCYLMGDFERAEDCYKNAGCWSCAYYSAYRNGKADAMKLYLAAYIENPDIFDRYMYRMYADMAADDKSVSALEKRFTELSNLNNNSDSVEQEVGYIAECLERIASKGGFDYKRCEGEDSFNFSKRAFSEIASIWSGKVQLLPEPIDKDSGSSTEWFVSTIVLFNIYENNAYGYIRNYDQTGNNHYFNIRQVNDDLLRKVLAVGENYKNLEVSFVLGMPFDPTQEPSADDVKLTERGRIEAEKRLEKVLNMSSSGEDTQGNIDRFFPYTMYGKIDASGSLHDFRIENVIDIKLLAYLLDGYKESDFASVMFRHKVHTNGKNIALNIRLNDKDIQVSDETVQRLINSGDITKDDIKRCNGNSDTFIDTDKLLGFPYEPLEPYIPATVSEPIKEVKTAVVEPVKTIVTEDAPISFTVYKHLPKLEPIDISGHTNIFSSLEPLVGKYYAKARAYLLNKNLAEAEELYIKAIRAKESLPSAVSDLVGLYLQDSERMLDAIDLIAAYGDVLEPKVRINHQAQIYGKRSDRPFMIRSCHVFEEAASLAPDNAKKMHHIYFQVRALYLLGEYQMALDSAKKWNNMYDMEVRYKGASAKSKYSTFEYGIRRFKSFCYYLLGDKNKASALAGELLNLNSSDELVRAVAQNTVTEEMLRKSSGLIQNSETEIDSIVEDEQDTEDVEIPGYTEYILEQTKIGDIFRDSRIIDNKYVGTPVQARKLIDEYKNREGKTSKSRSDILFCSAKVIYDVLEKNEPNIPKHITRAAAKNYIGRGFALLGDADICSESCNQQDTPRYCYIQTIRMLSRREKLESDLNRALVNYIDSFFVGKYELAGAIKSRASGQTPKVEWSIFNKKPLVTNEFVIGMTELYDALKFGVNVQREFIGAMERSGECQKLILQWFSENTDFVGGDIISLFTAGCIEGDKEIGELKKLLEGITNTILAGRFLENALNGISDFLKVSKWLCSEDRKRTERFRNALRRMNSYHESNDFQVRVNAVDNILAEFDKLRVDITGYPTAFSYDILLNVLDRAIVEVIQARNELYSEKYVPEVKLVYTVSPYIDSDNQVNVHLSVSNIGNKRQTADISRIRVDKLPDVECIGEEVERVYLRGGESKEFIFKFRISSQVKNIGSFTPTFVCEYGYSKGPSEYTTNIAQFSDPVVFRVGDFNRITNVFEGGDGHAVKDERMFFGRDEFIKELISELENPDGDFNYGHGVYLYGQTRAGKSSILHHFGRQLKEYYKDKDKKVIFVDIGDIDRVINCEIPDPFFNECNLLMAIIKEFCNEVERCHPDLKLLISDFDEDYNVDVMRKQPRLARTNFDNYLSDIAPYIKGEFDDVQRMIVITMDEFSAIHTAIKNNAFNDNFMKYWKSILQYYPVYTLIFGQDDMPRFVSDHQNEFACMRGSKVTYLSESACRELMEKPIMRIEDGSKITRYIGNSLDKLYKLTSGSAFLTVKLCKFMVEYLNDKRADVITPAIIDGFLRDRIFCSGKASKIEEADFEPQIRDRGDETLKDENKRLLIEIARRQDSEGWAEIDMLCPEGMDNERKRQLLFRLKERDVILIRENKYCSIVVGMLTEWLLAQYGKEGKIEL